MHNKCSYKIGIADQLKELGVAGKIILKCAFKNQDAMGVVSGGML